MVEIVIGLVVGIYISVKAKQELDRIIEKNNRESEESVHV